MKYILMIFLGLAESFKTMNRPGPTWNGLKSVKRYLTAYFSENLNDRDLKY